VLVGLNGWWNADEIVYGLEDSGAKVLVADAKRFERIAGSVDRIETLERVYLIDASARSSWHRTDPEPEAPRLLRAGRFADRDVPRGADRRGRPAVIFYTSGTTGRPKGAISTHRNMVANLQNTVFLLTATSMAQALPPTATRAQSLTPPAASPSSLFTAPLFHVAGATRPWWSA
jgi:long-chain acyl-CoA synthetase